MSVEVRSGSPLDVADRWFGVWPDPDAPGLHELLKSYTVSEGDRVDAEELDAADRELALLLRSRGFHGAEVSHRVEKRRLGRAARA